MAPSILILLWAATAAPAVQAQTTSSGTVSPEGFPSVSTAQAPADAAPYAALMFTSTAIYYGAPLSPDKGPWVLGEVRFIGAQSVSEYALQSKVRARRGNLYMPEDVRSDVASLLETGSFSQVASSVYAIADQPVPEGLSTIAVSTSMARLVFFVTEKGASAPTPGGGTQPQQGKAPKPPPPVPISGVVLTPTAYRGLGGHADPGLGFEFNTVYYIGRLYGKNSLSYTAQKTNFLDRIGLLILTMDGKMQLQSESRYRPAFAAGAQGGFAFKDGPARSLSQNSGVSVQITQKTAGAIADAYVVLSKRFYGVRTSVGHMQGNFGDVIGSMSEFLSPQGLLFAGHKDQTAQSKSVFFANALLLPNPHYPLAVEFLKPNGMALRPWLLNFKLGYFLKLNFDVSYLKYAGAWDLMGTFQFRTNYFPRR